MLKAKSKQPVTWITGCKINLYLLVHDVLPNGYHELSTFFLPLNTPHDTLHISQRPNGTGLHCTCSTTAINPANNTLQKAYTLYATNTGFSPALHIDLHKNVPIGAGLGGGSANAAGLLLYLQDLALKNGHSPLSTKRLIELATKVGADVPFFLINKPCIAQGIGESLTPIANPFAGYYVVLIFPAIAISTAWAFQALDALREKQKIIHKKLLTYSSSRGTSSLAAEMQFVNDFEEVICQVHPVITAIKRMLLDQGAAVALLSGSGSTVFGLFAHQEEAEKAVRESKYKYTYLTNV